MPQYRLDFYTEVRKAYQVFINADTKEDAILEFRQLRSSNPTELLQLSDNLYGTTVSDISDPTETTRVRKSEVIKPLQDNRDIKRSLIRARLKKCAPPKKS